MNKDYKEKFKNDFKLWPYICTCYRSKNNYARNINHGEAVLAGIILATKLSIIKKFVNRKH